MTWTDQRGYVFITGLKGHPLARDDGGVPQHRLVCWSKLGCPSRSPCYICGWSLPWKSPGAGFRQVVNVDHLNGTPGDDRPENLEPACFWCNANRQWLADRFPGLQPSLVKWFRHTEPHLRPHPAEVIGTITGLSFEEVTGRPDRRQEQASESVDALPVPVLAAVLDELAVPISTSVRKAREAISAAGIRASNCALIDAVRYRREMADW